MTKQPFTILKREMELGRKCVSGLAHQPSSDRQSAFADNMFRAEAVAYAPQVITSTFKKVGLDPWNTQRLRELCQMKATGVMPDTMSCAADVLAEKMKEKDVYLVHNVKSFSSWLEDAPASTLGTLSLAPIDGRRKHHELPFPQLNKMQFQHRATKRCMTTDASMEPRPKRPRLDTSHEVWSEPTCQRVHFHSTKMCQVSHVQQGILPSTCITLAQSSMLFHFTITHLSCLHHAAEAEHKEHKNIRHFLHFWLVV